MALKNIALKVLAIWIILKMCDNEAVHFRFSNAVCESYNKTWVVINQCRLRAISRNKTILNFNCTLNYPANDIFIDIQVFKRANGYKPWLIKAHLDACRFIKKPYNPYMIIIYNQFKDFTNINHSCPYVGDQLVQGLYLRYEGVRLPLPSGEYLIEMAWIFNKKKQFNTNVYFEFKED